MQTIRGACRYFKQFRGIAVYIPLDTLSRYLHRIAKLFIFLDMNRIYSWLGLTVCCLFLAACQIQMPALDQISNGLLGKDNFGSGEAEGFQSHLVAEYRALADFEEEVLGDPEGAAHFRNKAMKAASGVVTGPDEIDETKVPAEALPDLKQARIELLDALEIMDTEQNEPFLALAQAKYDCWLALQSDYPQYNDNFVCEEHFQIAMRFLIAPPMETGIYAVYFESASTSLDGSSMETLRAAVQEYNEHPGWRVSLKGFTDSTGNRYANEMLAKRRAVAVKNMLGQQGVDLDSIEIDAMGEAESDGTEEGNRHARRVEIEIVPRYGNGSAS